MSCKTCKYFKGSIMMCELTLGIRSTKGLEDGCDNHEDNGLYDNVNHPSHYIKGKYETIDVIQDISGSEGFVGYCIGNVVKYVSRHKHKNGIEDLKKARWYLDKLIEVMQK